MIFYFSLKKKLFPILIVVAKSQFIFKVYGICNKAYVFYMNEFKGHFLF